MTCLGAYLTERYEMGFYMNIPFQWHLKCDVRLEFLHLSIAQQILDTNAGKQLS